MSDLISRKDAIDAIMSEPPDVHYPSWYADILKELPSASTELSNNSPKLDNENGELISRQDAIDAMAEELLMFPIGLTEAYDVAEDALSGLPSAELERHYCRECKWSQCHINLDKYGRSETYWHCLNWDSGTDEEGFCHEWERRTG